MIDFETVYLNEISHTVKYIGNVLSKKISRLYG